MAMKKMDKQLLAEGLKGMKAGDKKIMYSKKNTIKVYAKSFGMKIETKDKRSGTEVHCITPYTGNQVIKDTPSNPN